jgi:alanine racemase
MVKHPTWAEISIDSLLHNFHLLRGCAGDAGLLAVVKANAYGHGAQVCATALSAAGAEWLGVTDVEEGIAVRAVCAEARLLVMTGIWKHEADAVADHNLTPVVWEPVHLEWLARVALRRGLPARSLPVHVEIDTGMSRQGVRPENLAAFLEAMRSASSLKLEGVMTHFHSPELLDSGATAVQRARFEGALELIQSFGFEPRLIHAGNSATVLCGTHGLANIAARHGARAMVRPGLALYGYAPRFRGEGATPVLPYLKPVLSWKAAVISLRTIEAGESAGYCATFRASLRSRLALLRVGYADGLNRLLSNRGEVLVRGQQAAIVGRVSMDLTIADVTNIEGVELGDEVVMIGEQEAASTGLSARISAYDHADWAGTIPYETLCAIGARVPRLTIGTGEGHV